MGRKNHVGSLDRFRAIASSTAFNCFNSSSRRVAADFFDDPFSVFCGDETATLDGGGAGGGDSAARFLLN